jgi:hypothetical protein
VVTARNACADLAATPSALVSAPEGMALLRLKYELESTAFTLQQQRQLQGLDAQRIVTALRGVDSLMRIVVRANGSTGVDGPVMTFNLVEGQRLNGHRPDSIRVLSDQRVGEPRQLLVLVDSTVRPIAPHPEAGIRLLQPQITSFILAVDAQSGRGGSASGYLGVGLLGDQVRTVTTDGVLVSHCDYPVVETVDIESPASRAGVLAGDTVLAYNGHDLKLRAINYQGMLVPGETIRVRVRRGSKSRELSVAVVARNADRPDVVFRAPGATPLALPPDLTRPVRGSLTLTPVPSARESAAPTPSAIAPSGVAVILGAQLAPLDADFAEELGLEPGILVLRVPPRSPFAEAGVRSGEVIHAVNGTSVRDVQALQRAIAAPGTGAGSAAGAREARLSVRSRTTGTRMVTLRW